MKYLLPLFSINTLMKGCLFVMLLIALISFKVGASGGLNTVNNYYYGNEDVSTRYVVGDTNFDMSMAMSAAGDTCVFDYAPGWQGCGGMGWYGSEQAFNGSAVVRLDQYMLRFNLQADDDFSEFAGGVGGSWHF